MLSVPLNSVFPNFSFSETPIHITETQFTTSEKESFLWAKTFAQSLKPGQTIAFFGNLGAGKTALIRGICESLGFKGTVCSPTYTVVHEYPGHTPIFHLDLYRLPNGADLEEIGIERILDGNGIAFIEWAERMENPTGITHFVQIDILSETNRKITVFQI